MAKTYILEPTEMTFNEGLYLDENVPFDAEAIAAIPSSVVVQIGDTILKYAYHSNEKIEFTENGQDDRLETFVGKFFNVKYYSSTNKTGYGYGEIGENGPSPIEGTYTVSIYTEDSGDKPPFTPERAGLPDMNVTLNYENPTNNGIALVTKALMWPSIQLLEMGGLSEEVTSQINDILYNPGYAPMERLVRAFVFYLEPNVDPYAADSEQYVVDFANDWERLAFAIRPEMFRKPESTDNDDEALQPSE